ncbi:flagellar export chaperone FliS [Bacillus gobiensis]|uniref:flagellar export chaperone FliS n=1 Tax=Bacillus gobiensis TaxID=1441095 RepID=UPI003D201F4E
MAMKNPYTAYHQNSVNTASPGELTLMLYNGCLKFIKLAAQSIQEGAIDQKNENLVKAQNIIQELQVTLNRDVTISEQFALIYDYIYRRLVEANVKNDLSILLEVEGYIIEFRDTWKQAIQIDRQERQKSGGFK